jgi:excisionase family DNA binding protein
MDEMMTPQEVWRFLKIGRNRTYGLLRLPEKRGGIPHIKIGKSIRVPRRELIDWCERQRSQVLVRLDRRRAV